jgi:antitoxin component YwqK of YwqJK toxin-antitoxin module
MKAIITRYIFVLTVVLSSGYCFSQNDTVTYYLDQNQRLCVKEKAVYVAKGAYENEKFKLSYFEFATGKLVSEIRYTDLTLAVKDGLFAEYDEEGHVLTKGIYVNNKEEGCWLRWNRGHLIDSIIFENGMSVFSLSFSYNQDEILESRILNDSRTKTLEITSYDVDGNLSRNTKWIGGTGDQIYYYPNGQVKTIEKYKDKKIVSIEHYLPDGTKISEKEFKKQQEKIMADFRKQMEEKSPSFPGGNAGFRSFFEKNFRTPQSFSGSS